MEELDIDVMRPKKMYKKLLQLRKISGEKFYHEYNDKFICTTCPVCGKNAEFEFIKYGFYHRRCRRINMTHGKNILVTGGAGFIGSCLASRLIDEGHNHNVVVIDNLSTGFESNIPQQAEFLKLDISKKDFTNKLPKIRFDYVFHLAAQSKCLLTRSKYENTL